VPAKARVLRRPRSVVEALSSQTTRRLFRSRIQALPIHGSRRPSFLSFHIAVTHENVPRSLLDSAPTASMRTSWLAGTVKTADFTSRGRKSLSSITVDWPKTTAPCASIAPARTVRTRRVFMEG
jgi:hypothetical protein